MQGGDAFGPSQLGSYEEGVGDPGWRPTAPFAQCLHTSTHTPSCAHISPSIATIILQDGCDDGLGPLKFGGCRLLASSCTLAPQVAARPAHGAIAGFPVTAPLLELPSFVTRTAQAVLGGDFPCDNSVLPEACAFRLPVTAAVACFDTPGCRSVVIYSRGGACSRPKGCSWGLLAPASAPR